MNILKNKILILASKSPRRQELLTLADIPFEIRLKEVEEIYPENLQASEVAVFLSDLKASVFNPNENEIILTADTIVVFEEKILGKPKDKKQAKMYLRELSGNVHKVITGYTLFTSTDKISSFVISNVTMDNLSDEEIDYYVDKYNPTDKAGAYGIQEWIGYTNIIKIDGSYPNIMGLPIHHVYKSLKEILNK